MWQLLGMRLHLVCARTRHLNEVAHDKLPRGILPEHESNTSWLRDTTLRARMFGGGATRDADAQKVRHIPCQRHFESCWIPIRAHSPSFSASALLSACMFGRSTCGPMCTSGFGAMDGPWAPWTASASTELLVCGTPLPAAGAGALLLAAAPVVLPMLAYGTGAGARTGVNVLSRDCQNEGCCPPSTLNGGGGPSWAIAGTPPPWSTAGLSLAR